MVSGCTIHAPAKLNLCLELLGKRRDGFHELRTLMASVRWFDTLRVAKPAKGDDLALRVDGPCAGDAPVDASNLVIRALEQLREAAGVAEGAVVRLTKRVPAQAGLGGGSSDAAAALVAGARLWRLEWGVDQLARLAARLGSDIPFFIHRILFPGRCAAVATGRGEQIEPVSIPAGQAAVIVKPAFGLSTAGVYRGVQPGDFSNEDAPEACGRVASALRRGAWQELRDAMRNDLENAAERAAPDLRELRRRFDKSGCAVHQLSGSGSAYFGLLRSFREATRLAATLRSLRVGQVAVTLVG